MSRAGRRAVDVPDAEVLDMDRHGPGRGESPVRDVIREGLVLVPAPDARKECEAAIGIDLGRADAAGCDRLGDRRERVREGRVLVGVVERQDVAGEDDVRAGAGRAQDSQRIPDRAAVGVWAGQRRVVDVVDGHRQLLVE